MSTAKGSAINPPRSSRKGESDFATPHRHPISLHYVCAVELCERFAASLFASLLVLYLNERLGMTQGQATRLSGAFSGIAYLASVAGGMLADRVIGARRAILLGLLLLTLGYAALSLDRATGLYPALLFLVAGQALFKPSMTAIVGKLYAPDDRRREDAYGVFYTAINISAATAPLAGGALRNTYGWSVAFAAAGVATLFAIGVFFLGYRRISEAAVSAERGSNTSSESSSVVATLVRTLPMLAGLLSSVLLFTAVFEQSGQSLVFWARDCTRRVVFGYTVPPSYFLALPGTIVLLMQPALSLIMRSLREKGQEPTAQAKIGAGVSCGVLAYAFMTWAAVEQRNVGPVSAFWLLGCFFVLTLGELLIYPIGMALVTRLVPAHAGAGAMGLWLVALALGQWLAGASGVLWEAWPHPWFFAMLAGTSIGALGLLTLSSKRIKQALCEKVRPK